MVENIVEKGEYLRNQHFLYPTVYQPASLEQLFEPRIVVCGVTSQKSN